jgi:NitT/TauT family transport system substrate-binding protein
MGLEFGYLNPRAAVEAVFEQFSNARQQSRPKLGRRLACSRRTSSAIRRSAPGGATITWALGSFSSTRFTSSSRSPPVKAEDVCTNALIAGANNFDRAKVKPTPTAISHKALRRSRRRRHKGASFDQAIPANR